MSGQFDLFAYPAGPGWKGRETSEAAARAVAVGVKPLRERVLAAIRSGPGTPEEIAKRIRVPVMNVRPRCSELARAGLIEDSGDRGAAMGGRRAIRWKFKGDKP